MQRSLDEIPFLAVVLSFVTALVFIIYTHQGWEDIIETQLPVQQRLTDLREDVVGAHLWLEEVIGGDRYVDIDKDVLERLRHESFKKFLVSDGPRLQGLFDEAGMKRLHKIDNGLDEIHALAQKRLRNIDRQGIGSLSEQTFDDRFKVLLTDIDTMSTALHEGLDAEMDDRRLFFRSALLIFLSINVIVFVVLYLQRRTKQRIEAALAREKEQALVTMRSIGDAVITTDTDGRVTFLNTVAEQLTGYHDAEAAGRPLSSVFEIINAMNGEAAIDPVDKVLKSGKIVGLANHTVLVARDGTRYQIADSAAPIKERDGSISGVVLVFRDVTEAYAMQELLKLEQERLEQAVNGTQVGLWDWDLGSDQVYFSARWKSMLGYREEELDDVLQTWADLVHPDDMEKAIQDIQKSHRSPGALYENIHRLRHKQGHWVWILDRGQTLFDERGEAVRMIGFHTDITEQKRVEEDLKSSRQRYQMLFDQSPVPLWEEDFTDLHHYLEQLKAQGVDDLKSYFDVHPDELFACLDLVEVEDVNRAVLQMYQAETKERLLGDLDKTFVESSLAVFKEELIALAAGEREFFSEAEVKTLNGDLRYVFLSLRITVDDLGRHKALLATTDISGRRSTEMALAASERKMRSLFHVAPIGIGLVIDSVIQDVNDRFCEITGYSREEVIGKSAKMLYPSEEEFEKVGVEKYRSIQEHGSGTVRTRFLRKDGEFIEIELSSTPLDPEDLSQGVTFTVLDITQQVRDTKELKEQEEMMLAQSRHAAMGEMISMIAHQWRQPLSIISMSVSSLLVDIDFDELDQDEVKRQSEIVMRQTEQLSHTIDDFRNFFRPNREKEAVTIASILQDTEKVIGPGLRNYAIDLSIRNSSDTTVSIYKRELIQVFLNLINNAKDAVMTHTKGEKKIVVSITEEGDAIVVDICDNGGGIDDAVITKVFDPYFTTKLKQTGTGLGLYMSKIIVEKHLAGRISVRNSEEGACFTLALPIA